MNIYVHVCMYINAHVCILYIYIVNVNVCVRIYVFIIFTSIYLYRCVGMDRADAGTGM